MQSIGFLQYLLITCLGAQTGILACFVGGNGECFELRRTKGEAKPKVGLLGKWKAKSAGN